MIRDFGSHVDRTKAKRLGQWATRLYIVLFVTLISILYIYNVVQSQTIKKTFNEPNIDFYNELIKDYGNQLKCPCSSITTMHNQFTQIKTVFHQVL